MKILCYQELVVVSGGVEWRGPQLCDYSTIASYMGYAVFSALAAQTVKYLGMKGSAEFVAAGVGAPLVGIVGLALGLGFYHTFLEEVPV